MERFELPEVVVFVLGTATTVLAGLAYFGVVPIDRYLQGTATRDSQEWVAIIGRVDGPPRRERTGEIEFKQVPTGTPLFGDDTIITSPSGGSRIDFMDGSILDLGPSTMIRLRLDTHFSLGGIIRFARVDLVSGQIRNESTSGRVVIQKVSSMEPAAQPGSPQALPSLLPLLSQASPSPSPSPSPLEVITSATLRYPEAGARLSIDPRSPEAELPIDFSWTVKPVPERVLLTLFRAGDHDPLLTSEVKMASEAGSFHHVFRAPGEYRWVIAAPVNPGKALAESTFAVDPRFEGIELGDPLIAGDRIRSNAFRSHVIRDFYLALSWRPYPKVDDYTLTVQSDSDGKKKQWSWTVHGTSYTIKNTLIAGKVDYQVVGRTPSGFVVRSPLKSFQFDYLPPNPISPADQSRITQSKVDRDGGTVLLTWIETNFTPRFEVMVSRDPSFSSIIANETVSENFIALPDPGPGRYFWRVSSVSKDGRTSGPSRPFSFEILR